MPHTSFNNGGTTAQFPNPTLISGSIRTLGGTAVSTASNTKATQAALAIATLLVQMTPEATTAAAVTIPAAPATWNNVGWQMDTNAIQYGDPGTTTGNTVPVVVNWTSSTAGSVTFTVILFASGAEIGRGSVVASTTTSAAAYTVNVAVNSGVSIPANGKIQMSVYALLPTNVGLGAVTYTYNYGTGATGSQIGVPSYSIQATKTVTDTYSSSEAVTRAGTYNRTITDSASTSDAVARAASHPRATTEALTTTDVTSRVASFPRTVADSVPTSDVVARAFTGSRATTDSVPTSDAVTRLIIYGRFTYEYPQGASPDYTVQFPTKHIAGFVRNSDGTVFFGGATMQLIRDSDNKVVQTGVSSTVDGSYSFVRDLYDPNTYHVAAFYPSAPEQGVTQTGLVPV